MALKRVIPVLIVAGLLFVSTVLAQSGNFLITLWSFSNGGGQSADSRFTLVGTAGQFSAASSTANSGRFTVAGGFWSGPQASNNTVHLPLIARANTPTPIPPPSAVWQRMDTNSGLNVTSLAIQGQQLFIGTRNGAQGLYRRDLNTCQPGRALTAVNVAGASTVLGIIFQDAEGIVAAFGDHLFYSNNNGQNWTKTGKNIDHPRAVAIAGNHTFFAGAENGGIYRSVNGGVDWTRLSGTSQSVNQLRLDALDRNSLWIANNQNGVSKLTVDAERLLSINEGLSGANQEQVWDFAFANIYIYIATSDGVFFRGDRNTPWQRVGTGLAGKKVYSLEVVGNDLLYAGTNTEGVWRRPLNGSHEWEQVSSAGWNNQATVRDLLYDPQSCKGLLAGTDDGVWLYR